MSVQAIEQEMHHYFTLLNEAEKKSVVQMLKTFLEGRKENADAVSLEECNRDIDEAMEEVSSGNYITQEELEKESEQWQKK